ncbi:MAG TPA: hypothetical protein VGR02_10800 [Thermoanaerobaculia bacterium]|jgi:hypothetical protein|nr:hypothetical protein [Thermoanaerobaculia bacterium]
MALSGTQRSERQTRTLFVVRSAGRETAVILLFLLAAAVLTWPLAIRLPTAVSDLGDPLLNVWILDWVCHSLTHAPLELFNAPIYYPGKLPLAYSENMIGVALTVLPFYLAGASPITLHGIATLLGFALSGYGAFVLARMLTRNWIASLVAGLFYAFVGFKFDHLSHLQILCSGWLPLMLAALLAYWRTPTRGRAVLLAAAFVMNALTNVHYLLFGSLAVALTILYWALVAAPRDRRFWLRLLTALAVAGLLVAPLLIPYRIVSQEYDMKRGRGETEGGSAHWSDWLMPVGGSVLYHPVTAGRGEPERHLFPGLLIVFLAAAAFLMRERSASSGQRSGLLPADRRSLLAFLDVAIIVAAVFTYIGMATDQFQVNFLRVTIIRYDRADVSAMVLFILILARCSIALPRFIGGNLRTLAARSRFTVEEQSATLWIFIGVFGSLGLNFFFHAFLFSRTGVFRSIRVPARWAIIAYVGLAAWGALGAAEVLRRGRRRHVIASLLVVAALLDVWPRVKWEMAVPEPAPVYKWLARVKRGPVLELPMSGFGVQYLYMLANTAHHVPIYDGLSGFEPPVARALRDAGEKHQFSDAYLGLVERTGGGLLVVHADWLVDQVPSLFAFLKRNLANGRLGFVRRFDHGLNGDWVFAVTRNVPDWQTLRAPDERDGAGFLPDQNVQRLLAHQPTYTGSTFGIVESPRNVTEINGVMHLSGWAMSPHGISRVRVLVDAGRRIYDADLHARPDISAAFPWYPRTTTPWFTLDLGRPKGVNRETDVQVEVIDGRGKATRFPDLLVWWD